MNKTQLLIFYSLMPRVPMPRVLTERVYSPRGGNKYKVIIIIVIIIVHAFTQ